MTNTEQQQFDEVMVTILTAYDEGHLTQSEFDAIIERMRDYLKAMHQIRFRERNQ